MIARTLALLSVLSLSLAACGQPAGSDPLTPRVCKALKDVAAKAAAQKPDAEVLQIWVVMGIANEVGDDLEKLGAYVSKADAETEATCPADRKAVLDLSGKASLAAVIR